MITKRTSFIRGVIFTGLPLVGIGWLWLLGGGSPNIAVNYVAKFNENADAIPESERAWPIYLEAIALLPTGEESTAFLELIKDASPDKETWPDCVRAIEAHTDAIALIREAASKPATGIILETELSESYLAAKRRTDEVEIPTGPGPAWALDVQLPQLGEFRTMARLLRIDALHAAKNGDPARVAADIEAMAGLGRHAREHPIVISQLVSSAIGGLASQSVLEMVHDSPGLLDNESLTRIDLAIASAFTGPETVMDLTGDRNCFLDYIQRLYTDDGRGDGRITASGLKAFASRQVFDRIEIPTRRIVVGFMSLFSMSRAELTSLVNRLYDDTEAYAATPPWERKPKTVDTEIAQMHAGGNPLDLGQRMFSFLMPALNNATIMADRSRTEAEAARVVIALERFRLAHGQWPNSLDELVPSLLDLLPPDPFTGEPLLYSLTEDGPVLYSVGMDREDDGGRHSEMAEKWRPAEMVQNVLAGESDAFGGDWVLFPPPERDD